jgi:hypothetical protein
MTPPEADPVTALGHVDPPPPDVLDVAREALWSAITHEMLTTDPAARPAAAPHLSPEPRARRQQSS